MCKAHLKGAETNPVLKYRAGEVAAVYIIGPGSNAYFEHLQSTIRTLDLPYSVLIIGDGEHDIVLNQVILELRGYRYRPDAFVNIIVHGEFVGGRFRQYEFYFMKKTGLTPDSSARLVLDLMRMGLKRVNVFFLLWE